MTRQANSARKKIGALQRALDILGLFDARTAELGNTEIADALGLHKSTVAGLIYTLEANGYLEQNPATRKYRLGLKLLERASILLNHLELRQTARPHLEALRNVCNESVNLGVQDGADVVYIERILGSHALGMRSEVGKRTLLHSTALGKALLAWLPPAELPGIVAELKFQPVTAKTILDPARYIQSLHETRARGFAIDDEENEIGGRCVAAPVFDYTGNPVAAVSVSMPSQRASDATLAQIGERVRETARAISYSLGYLPKPF